MVIPTIYFSECTESMLNLLDCESELSCISIWTYNIFPPSGDIYTVYSSKRIENSNYCYYLDLYNKL